MHKTFVGKPEEKRTLVRARRRREDNIRINIKENSVRRCGLDSSGSGYGQVAASCEHGNEPLGPIKGEECHEHL
jgi:hypothetical protein